MKSPVSLLYVLHLLLVVLLLLLERSTALLCQSATVSRRPSAVSSLQARKKSTSGSDDLPLDQYKNTIDEFQDVVNEANAVAAKLQVLSQRLKDIEATDPDITSTSSASNLSNSNHDDHLLQTAVEHALRVSEVMGRSCLETELAWCQVDRLNNNEIYQKHPLLSHVSYRYNYAYHMLLLMNKGRENAATQSSKKSVSQQLERTSDKIEKHIQLLQDLVQYEHRRLEDRERTKMDMIHRWMEVNWESGGR